MITTPLARYRSFAIFWWSLAVAFEGWLSLRVMLPWLMGTMVRFEGDFAERVMEGWDEAAKTWPRVPPWRQALFDRLVGVGGWLSLGVPLLLALLTWLVARRGTATIHLWAAGAGLAVIGLDWSAYRLRQVLISCPGCPGGTPLSWWETAELVIPALLIIAGCLAGLPRTTIRTRPYRQPLPRWQTATLAVVVLAAAGTYGHLNSGRLLGRCSYDWDGPSSYLPQRADEVKILGRGCDSPEFREQIAEELRWLAEARQYRNAQDAVEVSPAPTPPPAKPPVCASARRAPAWRPPAPRVTARVDAAWRRIENWLAEHAPGDRAKLRPPATRHQIRKVEAALGGRLPDDLRASLLRHNGAETALFVPVYTPMSAALIRTTWQGQFCGDHDMMPFAIDVSGDTLVVTRKGKVGEFSMEMGMDFDPRSSGWPSYPALLEDVANSLESGTPLRDWLPHASADGEFTWIECRPCPGRPDRRPGGRRPAPEPNRCRRRAGSAPPSPPPPRSTGSGGEAGHVQACHRRGGWRR